MGDIIKNLYEAKTKLSSLVEGAAKCEEIIIAKNCEPMARLVPYESTKGRRVPGCGKGKIWISDDVDAPLPADILAALEEPIEPVSGHSRLPMVVRGQQKPGRKRPRRNPRS